VCLTKPQQQQQQQSLLCFSSSFPLRVVKWNVTDQVWSRPWGRPLIAASHRCRCRKTHTHTRRCV
jgi:hypothetical protein